MSDIETALGPGLKISCSREELAQKVAVVSRGVSTRTAVQILGGILIRAEGTDVQLADDVITEGIDAPLIDDRDWIDHDAGALADALAVLLPDIWQRRGSRSFG